MKAIYILLLLLIPILINAQQRPDTTFNFTIENPKYAEEQGPVICIDSAHNNFHTIKGGFAPFAKVVRRDGYNTIDQNDPITDEQLLSACNIYLIVNPLHESNIGNWRLPTPSAFTQHEIQLINKWVNRGGVLWLIADHMPFSGAARDLAASFGYNFSNGFATLEKEQNQPDLFTIENGRLSNSPISGKKITSITSFTGSAFTFPEEAIPVMKFKEGDYSLEPETAWQFEDNTDTLSIENYAQGALLPYGNGKIAVFGEAAMFTAQLISSDQGDFKIGINNSNLAPQNLRFLLNLIHWLDDGE